MSWAPDRVAHPGPGFRYRGAGLRAGLLAAAVVVLCLIGAPRPASASASVLAAVPEPGSTLQGNPPLINVRYTERLAAAGSSLELSGPDGAVVGRGGVAADGSYPTNMWIEDLPTLEPGVYTVRSVATSAVDGVTTRFEWTFTVVPIPPGATPEPEPICTDGCNGFSTDAAFPVESPASGGASASPSPIASPSPSAPSAPAGSVGAGGSALLVAAALAIVALVLMTVLRRRHR
jgi:methionine-rich copper-binding protein CopC